MLPEAKMASMLGFSIPDIVGLGLGFMAAVLSLIALTAAVIIFFLGVRHSRHLTEIEAARKELLKLTEEIKGDIEKNLSLLREVHLGFGVIRSLINLQGQERLINSIKHSSVKPELKDKEILLIRNKVKARELELHILASRGMRCKASMQGLAQTFGNDQTIEFFQEYASILESRGNDTRNIYEALGLMQGRMQILDR